MKISESLEKGCKMPGHFIFKLGHYMPSVCYMFDWTEHTC